MVKVTMAHLYLFQLTILLVVLSTSLVVDSQFFFNQPIRPLYFLHKNNNNPNARPSQSQLINQHNYPPHHFSPNNPNQRSQEPLTSSEEEQNEGDNGSGSREEAGPGHYRRGALNSTSNLPAGFDDSVRANRPPLEPRPVSPLYGDPAVMDDEEEQVRSRYLWPFSTTVTVSKNKRPSPHHSQHLSGFQPPHPLPPHLMAHHHRHPPHRRDKYADLEYDKTRLKYEIYKLKAKKTISILQNKVELKKILSLILQQKIRALEWFTWYHDYVEQMYNTAQGGGSLHDSGDGEGWGEEQYGLTDEEILHSKGSKTKLKKKTAKASASSSQGLKRRRKKLQKDDDDETESDSDKEKLDEATSTPQPTQASRWSSFFGGGLLKRLRTSLRFGSTSSTTTTTTTTTTTKAPKKKESKKPGKQSQTQQSPKPHPSRSPQHRIRKQKLRPKPKETFNSESQEASSSSSSAHKHHLKTSQDEEEYEEEIDDTDTDETYNKNNDSGNPGENEEAQDEDVDVDEGNLTYPDADPDNDDTVVENDDEDLEDAESEVVHLATEAEDVVDENEDVVEVNRSGENEEAPAEEDEEDAKQNKDAATASAKVEDDAGREENEDMNKYRDEKVPSSVGGQDENGKEAIIVPTTVMTPGAPNGQRKKLKKGEKKKNLKNSIYSILFKTMDAIDKKFSDDDEEDLDPDL